MNDIDDYISRAKKLDRHDDWVDKFPEYQNPFMLKIFSDEVVEIVRNETPLFSSLSKVPYNLRNKLEYENDYYLWFDGLRCTTAIIGYREDDKIKEVRSSWLGIELSRPRNRGKNRDYKSRDLQAFIKDYGLFTPGFESIFRRLLEKYDESFCCGMEHTCMPHDLKEILDFVSEDNEEC